VKLLLILYSVVVLVAFFAAPTMGGGWAWDLTNSLGFAAFAGMLYLTLPIQGTRNIRIHEHLSYAVILIILAHGFWFLLADAASVEYVKADAPLYMWTGVASLVLLFLSILVSVLPTRTHVHGHYSLFKFWHRLLAILAIAGAAYHIVESGFYLATQGQVIVFVLLVLLVCFARNLKRAVPQSSAATPGDLIIVTVVGAALFATVKNGL
jgi:Na+-transporting methylmalonyl-CoA/oxaloacetate decarboxylase gamma subunit